jgi:hypothetical protein
MKQHTIALVGMSTEQIDGFRTALRVSTADWALVDDLQADLLVVDVDESDKRFKRLLADLDDTQRIAAFTRQKSLVDHDLVIEKPLYSNRLELLLESISEQLAAPASMAEGDEVVASADLEAHTDGATESEDDRSIEAVRPTIGACLLAGHVTALRVQAGDIELLLDPESNSYHATSGLKPLRALLELPIDEAQPLDAADIEHMRETPGLPMLRLRWFAALCATPGQLSATLDPQAAYRLTRWPQIEREFAHHFRIATAMFKRAGTLQDIAAAVPADVTDVADFINAYSITGHVAVEVAQSGAVTKAVATDPDRAASPKWRNLLTREFHPFAAAQH